MNVSITSSPALGVDTVLCDNQNVTLTCHTDQPVVDITWHWSDKSEQGNTITVLAKLTNIVYTCMVSNDGQDIGEANITIKANGELMSTLCSSMTATHDTQDPYQL